MSHMVFYREWRPQTFHEVVGQEHIVRTLQNALAFENEAHAYLFSGPRGTGKTSIAKIVAKTVNCLNGPAKEPCNMCANCRRISEGAFVDVMEIDAASNRGIDEIRELKERVRYLPAEGKCKVYIIDEVHMMTTEAFNALLKTLEEPPSHVLFLLATTEPHKLPATILSRCQRFDFHRLSVKAIAKRLREAADSYEIDASDSALALIARYAEGSLRDALGLLEQASAYGDRTISEANVLSILGTIGEETVFLAAEGIGREDPGSVLEVVNEVVNSGKDPRELVSAVCRHYRNMLVVKTCSNPNDMLGLTDTGIHRLKEQSKKYTERAILDLIEDLSHAENEMKWSIQPRITAEMFFIRCMGLGRRLAWEQAEEKLERLEEKLSKLKEDTHRRLEKPKQPYSEEKKAEPIAEAGLAPQQQEGSQPVSPEKEPEEEKERKDAQSEVTLDEIQSKWDEVMERTKKRSRHAYGYLLEGRLHQYKDKVLGISFPYSIHKEQVEKKENRKLIEKILEDTFAEPITLGCTLSSEEKDDTTKVSEKAGENGEKDYESSSDSKRVDEGLDLFGGQLFDISK